jgi:ribosomal protein S11
VKYPTGTGSVTANAVQVSPNPTSGIIRVSNTQANQTVRITDVTGSLKGTYKTGEGTTTIDLTGYAKGTYLLQYNGKTFKVIRK